MNLKGNLVAKLICCTPFNTLIDDEDIAKLDTSMEAPTKCELASLLTDTTELNKENPAAAICVDYASDTSTLDEERSEEEWEHNDTAEAIQQGGQEEKIMGLTSAYVCEPHPEPETKLVETEPNMNRVPSNRLLRCTHEPCLCNKKPKADHEVESVIEHEPGAAIYNVKNLRHVVQQVFRLSTYQRFDHAYRIKKEKMMCSSRVGVKKKMSNITTLIKSKEWLDMNLLSLLL